MDRPAQHRESGDRTRGRPRHPTLLQLSTSPIGTPPSGASSWFMGSDLVALTTRSSYIDPKDLLEVIGAYRAARLDVVQTREGPIAQFMADGIVRGQGRAADLGCP
jgi:hypothetical protein